MNTNSQKWSKGMIKAFRDQYGDDIIKSLCANTTGGSHSTPSRQSAAATGTPRTKPSSSAAGSSSRKRSAKTSKLAEIKAELEDVDDDNGFASFETPSKKKPKVEDGTVKLERKGTFVKAEREGTVKPEGGPVGKDETISLEDFGISPVRRSVFSHP